MERQSKGSRCLEAYCKGGQGLPRAVAPPKKIWANAKSRWNMENKTNELRQRMKQEDIIKFIKSQRLRWVAHVMRMENTRTTRKITEWKPFKTRPVGRPRLRWMDQVEEGLRRMKITGWRVKIEDRQVWNRTVEQTKTHPGL